MFGSFSNPILADDLIKSIVSKVRGQVESKFNNDQQFIQFTPISYQVQVVAGTNYLVKVKCDIGLIELLIFKDLNNQVYLIKVDLI